MLEREKERESEMKGSKTELQVDWGVIVRKL